MSARIMPLRLEDFEQLPKHARRCVFWEVDPATLGNQDHLADPEFEKEAWLSMVMLEWGSCGQVATAIPDDERSHAEQPCLGYVLYAAGKRAEGEQAIEQALGKKAIRELLPLQPGDVPNTCADISSLVEAVDYRPATPVREGVARFANWYRDYFRV